MTQKSFQNLNKFAQKEISFPTLPLLHCAVKGHDNQELKFISKKEYPNISRIYCPACIIETAKSTKISELQLVCLDDVFEDTISLAQKYMIELEPVMVQLQIKQEQLTKNDFKNMFQSVLFKRRRFQKTIQKFKTEVSLLCQKYEEFFEKELEQSFYQSFFAIDSRLSTFKDTYEVLRLRLSSYSQELEKSLKLAQDIPQLCESVSTVLKDFNSLQSSRLLNLMTQEIEETPSNSEIAESFNADCAIENELSNGLNCVLEALNQKIESIQKDFVETKKKPKSEKYLTKNQDMIDEEGIEINKALKEPQKIWADPADESIEIFEREIAKFYQGDLIKRLAGGLENDGEEKNKQRNQEQMKGTTIEEKPIQETEQKSKEKMETRKEICVENTDNEKEGIKDFKEFKKEKNGIKKNSPEEIKGKLQEIMETADSDENYISEDEEDDEEEEDHEELQRELINQLKNSVQPEIFRRLFKSRKYLRKSDRHLRLGLVKFSQTIIEDNSNSNRRQCCEDCEEEHCYSILAVVNKDKGKSISNQISGKQQKERKTQGEEGKKEVKNIQENNETREKKGKGNKNSKRKIKNARVDSLIDFVSQLKKEIVNPEAFQRLQKLVCRIQLTSTDKNKRLLVQDILSIQDFIGEFLRQNNQNYLIEYRKQRRQFNDNDEATKYNYVCRDFFVKYYNHYKSIKTMFLDELGVSKKIFNYDYKYWVENGHSYLAWSRFKSKVQKASLIESKHTINSADLKGILNQLLYFLKDPLGEFKEDIIKTKKKERYLLVELLLARVYDRAFFAFQIEEEDILASLRKCSGQLGKEALKLYEEFEIIIANVMYPGLKIQVNYENGNE